MLTSLILIPLIGALVLAPMNEKSVLEISRIKQVALITTLLTFAVSMVM